MKYSPYLPYAFTGHGAVMLASNASLARKVKAMEKKYDEQFKVVFEAIYQLMEPPKKEQRRIGFKREKEK